MIAVCLPTELHAIWDTFAYLRQNLRRRREEVTVPSETVTKALMSSE